MLLKMDKYIYVHLYLSIFRESEITVTGMFYRLTSQALFKL